MGDSFIFGKNLSSSLKNFLQIEKTDTDSLNIKCSKETNKKNIWLM